MCLSRYCAFLVLTFEQNFLPPYGDLVPGASSLLRIRYELGYCAESLPGNVIEFISVCLEKSIRVSVSSRFTALISVSTFELFCACDGLGFEDQ